MRLRLPRSTDMPVSRPPRQHRRASQFSLRSGRKCLSLRGQRVATRIAIRDGVSFNDAKRRILRGRAS
jgi:hypothetical protein